MDRSKFILLQEHLQKKVGKRVARSIVERLAQPDERKREGSGKDGMNASGKLSDSIQFDPTDEGVVITAGKDNKYAHYLDDGVGKQKASPSYAVIKQWIKDKGIKPEKNDKGKVKTDKQLVYAIKNSIWKNGILPATRNWLKNLIKDQYEEWTEDVPDIALEDVLNNIDEILIDAGFIQQSDKTIFKRRNE